MAGITTCAKGILCAGEPTTSSVGRPYDLTKRIPLSLDATPVTPWPHKKSRTLCGVRLGKTGRANYIFWPSGLNVSVADAEGSA